MWCCAGKPEAKKPLRSARQQPLQKVTLNLPPMIRLEYKNKWQGKVNSQNNQKPIIQEKPQKQITKQNPQKIADMLKQLEESKKKKRELEQGFNRQVEKGKQLQEGLNKMEAISKVLEYMILREEQKIDGFVLKIKS